MDGDAKGDAGRDDGREMTRYVLVALTYVAVVILTAIITNAVASDHTTTGKAVEDAQAEVEEAPGMPLDAVQYQSPAWMPDAKQVFEVVDRINGMSWWVIRTSDDQWVTLPIGRRDSWWSTS